MLKLEAFIYLLSFNFVWWSWKRENRQKVDITKNMSPHRVRHSSITTALDHSNGNYRKVQNLSRHANIDTIQKYDDNRQKQKQQREISSLLADLITHLYTVLEASNYCRLFYYCKKSENWNSKPGSGKN